MFWVRTLGKIRTSSITSKLKKKMQTEFDNRVEGYHKLEKGGSIVKLDERR